MNGPVPVAPVADDEEQSLAFQAYTQIEERIATLSLKPGQIVSENGLSKLLGLGRTPVREALQQLAREGLVVIVPKLGIIISDIDVRKQLKLLEVRRELERYLAAVATKRADTRQRAEFAALAQQMELAAQANDGDAFLAHDRTFNRLLLEAAHNEYATSAMKLMQGLSRRFWYAHYKESANLPEAARLHARIASAIAEGSEDLARDALDRLIDNVETFTRAALDSYR
jgi:DNA-binding GntR family transcriptional regulator